MSALSEHTTDLLYRSYLSTTLRSTRASVAAAIESKSDHYPRLESLVRDIDAALATIETTKEPTR